MIAFKSIKTPPRMPAAIVKQIENKILLGQLKPNSKLPSKIELTKQFGVSRNTVREALRILETSGMIKIKRGSLGGPVVYQLTTEFISDFMIKGLRSRTKRTTGSTRG